MAGYLSPEDHARVSAAVSAAEAQTSGEIVTILAERSDGYTDVALAWSMLAAFTAIVALSLTPDFYLGLFDRVTGSWANEWTPGEIFALAASVGIVKFVAMMLLQLWQPLKFLLIPGPVKSARCRARAFTFFKVGAERRTEVRTGILIYLSMREHRAEIVADETIADRVTIGAWEEAMAAMLGHIREGRVADGMIAAVDKVGAVLALHCPRADDDRNELPDRLIEV
jgi:putative membrane protein